MPMNTPVVGPVPAALRLRGPRSAPNAQNLWITL